MLPAFGLPEYEAFGGRPVLSGGRLLPGSYPYPDMETLEEKLRTARDAVLFSEAFARLYRECEEKPGEAVCLEGSFSVLCTLMDPQKVFRAIRRQPEQLRALLRQITDILVIHAERLLAGPVRVLSLADPTAGADILGRKNQRIALEAMTELLRRICPLLRGQCVHLCGRCSADLEAAGFLRRVELPYRGVYEDGVWQTAEREEAQILGNGCLRNRAAYAEGLSAYTFTDDTGRLEKEE